MAQGRSAFTEPWDYDDQDSDTESAQRDEYRLAAREGCDPTKDLPPIKKGQRKMPSQRCTATTKKDVHCGKRTCFGKFCAMHLKHLASLRVTKSTAPDAGKGLFALRDFKLDEKICRYTGDFYRDDDAWGRSDYVLQINRALWIDASRTNSAVGRFSNDPKGTGKRVNARFSINPVTKEVTLKALRPISKGDELFTAYGSGYWKQKAAQGEFLRAQTGRKRGPKANAALTKETIPTTVREAYASAHAAEWRKAVEAEFASLRKHGVWSVVDSLPKGMHAIPTKMVMAVKYNEQGGVEKRKARLTARGDRCWKSDYNDTFAATMAQKTFRTLCADAVLNGYVLENCDIVTAFLHGVLKEEIYIVAPEGLDGIRPGQFLRLHKTLYGLPQASNEWNKKLHSEFIKLGYTQLKDSDECVFTRTSATGQMLKLGNFVDDIIKSFKEADREEMQRDITQLGKVFEIKELGPLKMIIGYRVTRNWEARTITLDQQPYLARLLSDCGYAQVNAAKTPGTKKTVGDKSGHHPRSLEDEESAEERTPKFTQSEYRSIVGALQWVASGTRPDIAYVVNSFLARHLADPQLEQMQDLTQLLRYLAGTLDLGIVFTGNSADTYAGQLTVTSDSDWAEDKERRSVSGILFKLAGGPISWCSKRQPTVSLSSTEAEYNAVCEAGREALFLVRLCNGVGVKQNLPTVINCDNQSTIATAIKDGNLDRRKHIDVKHHWIREKLETGEFELKWIASVDNEADILTKALAPQIFAPLRQKMLGYGTKEHVRAYAARAHSGKARLHINAQYSEHTTKSQTSYEAETMRRGIIQPRQAEGVC